MEVSETLRKQGTPASSDSLWEEIYAAYERGGSQAVEDLLKKKVKAIRTSANAQGREMKEAAGAVAKKGRKKRGR